jgi:parvulin-like peptidyl-prolyl isomerase
MKINANLLDPKIEAASIQDWARLDSPLKRLSQNLISGEEVVELLQQYRLLSQLQRELIIDTELESIECTAEEIFSAYKAFYHHQQINSDRDRATWLEQNHFTLSQRETFGSKVDSYFLQRKSQLDRASYSLLRVKDFHLAQELFFRLEAGEATFPELVKQYSQGQEAETGGSIGPHELSIPHPILVQKIRSLKLGQLAPPLQIAEWFVVIRLDKFFSAQLDEKMRERLIEEIYDRWTQNQLNQLNR